MGNILGDEGPNTAEMQKNVFNLKMTSKQFARESKKCEKQEGIEKKKIKQAIEKNNMEGAKIYAENAIRQKNQALNYLRLSSRLDGVAARLETALRMNKVTQSMGQIVRGMDRAMESMNLEEISQIMDKFEQQFEDLDVRSAYIENAMGASTATTTPVGDVDNLIQQVAEQHGLEVSEQLNVNTPATGIAAAPNAVAEGDDDLTARLAALRAQSG